MEDSKNEAGAVTSHISAETRRQIVEVQNLPESQRAEFEATQLQEVACDERP